MNQGFEIQCLPGAAGVMDVSVEATSGNTRPASWYLEWATGGHRSDAGVAVNGYSALTHCPLWQAVNIIAGDVGQTPVRLLKDEFNEQRTHPAWKLLRLRPNSLQTPAIYTETIIQWALIWGNGVSWIVRRGSQPTDLIPLRPDCLWPELVAFDDEQVMLYHYTSPTSSRQYTFFPDEVCHIQGLTGDGVWGYALHEIAKNTIGHGLALEKHGNRSFANGARPSGVLKHPEKLSPEARRNLREEWNAIHEGTENSGKIAILQEAMEFQAMAMTNIDAQWLEAKKAGVYEAASLTNLPPHKLGAMDDSSSRANLEEQNADYSQRTLTRWFTKLGQEYRRKLLTTKEWLSDRFEFVFDIDQVLRADIDTLSQFVERMVSSELMNRNEARRLFRLPRYEGGERFGSPHINPQPAPQASAGAKNPQEQPEDGEKTPETPEKTEFRNAHVELLVDRVSHLIECETSRLRHAAANAPNFVSWLDEFYVGDGGKSKLHSIYDAVMGKSVKVACAAGLSAHAMEATIAAWGLHRRNTILDACSLVARDDLVEMVESFIVRSPQETAEQLLLTVLEDQ